MIFFIFLFSLVLQNLIICENNYGNVYSFNRTKRASPKLQGIVQVPVTNPHTRKIAFISLYNMEKKLPLLVAAVYDRMLRYHEDVGIIKDGYFPKREIMISIGVGLGTVTIATLTSESYKHLGYARGHLFPFRDWNVWSREDTRCTVNSYLNVAPQNGPFNTAWNNLVEERVRKLLSEDSLDKEGIVVTGISMRTMLHKSVHIPQFFWKIVFYKNKNGIINIKGYYGLNQQDHRITINLSLKEMIEEIDTLKYLFDNCNKDISEMLNYLFGMSDHGNDITTGGQRTGGITIKEIADAYNKGIPHDELRRILLEYTYSYENYVIFDDCDCTDCCLSNEYLSLLGCCPKNDVSVYGNRCPCYKCDDSKNLVCIDGTCNCKDGFKFNNNQCEQNGGGGGGGGCFSLNSNVMMDDFSFKNIKEINKGENVLAIDKNGKIIKTKVIAYLHNEKNTLTEFLEIETENKIVLVLTPNHLIYEKSKGYIQAQKLELNNAVNIIFTKNSSLSFSKVIRISVKIEKGFISPLTESGTLIVNGIHVSCYASINNHNLAHVVMKPITYWYKTFNYFENEFIQPNFQKHHNTDYFHPYAKFLMFLGFHNIEFLDSLL